MLCSTLCAICGLLYLHRAIIGGKIHTTLRIGKAPNSNVGISSHSKVLKHSFIRSQVDALTVHTRPMLLSNTYTTNHMIMCIPLGPEMLCSHVDSLLPLCLSRGFCCDTCSICLIRHSWSTSYPQICGLSIVIRFHWRRPV